MNVSIVKCRNCGAPAPAAERCTNGHCAKCHRTHCTPGGATSPGHLVRRATAPTTEQLDALLRWKLAHGRTWKAKLGDAWMRAGEGVLGYEPALQQLRNHFGPTWLQKVKL